MDIKALRLVAGVEMVCKDIDAMRATPRDLHLHPALV
jgi:hypothetical protein